MKKKEKKYWCSVEGIPTLQELGVSPAVATLQTGKREVVRRFFPSPFGARGELEIANHVNMKRVM